MSGPQKPLRMDEMGGPLKGGGCWKLTMTCQDEFISDSLRHIMKHLDLTAESVETPPKQD